MSAGFYLPKLEQAIYDRLVADTTLIGSSGYASSVRNTFTAEGPFPLVSFEITDARVDDCFNVGHHAIQFRVHTWCEEEPLGAAYNGFARSDQMLTRIVGDWEDQATRSPSFGLNRYQPSITSSSWTSDIIILKSCRPSHDPGILHYVLDFECRVSKAGA